MGLQMWCCHAAPVMEEPGTRSRRFLFYAWVKFISTEPRIAEGESNRVPSVLEANMSIRPVKRLVRAKPTLEGAGVHLRRAFGFGNTSEFDPFLLLDDFRNDIPE